MFREITEEEDAALMGPGFLSHASEAASPPSQTSPASLSAAQTSAAQSTASLASPRAHQTADRRAPLPDPASNEAALWAAWEQAEAEAEAAEAAGLGHCTSI